MLKTWSPLEAFNHPMIRRSPQAPCNYCARYGPSHRTKPVEPPLPKRVKSRRSGRCSRMALSKSIEPKSQITKLEIKGLGAPSSFIGAHGSDLALDTVGTVVLLSRFTYIAQNAARNTWQSARFRIEEV